MESSDNPKRCGWSIWSIVRKAQVIGVLIGTVGTIGFSLAGSLFNSPHGGTPDSLGALEILLCLPTWIMLKKIGLESLLVDNGGQLSVVPLCLPGLVNGVLLFFAGTLIGWLIQKFKTKN